MFAIGLLIVDSHRKGVRAHLLENGVASASSSENNQTKPDRAKDGRFTHAWMAEGRTFMSKKQNNPWFMVKMDKVEFVKTIFFFDR